MSDLQLGRCYKLTAIKAPDTVDIDTKELKGIGFFEDLQTITEISEMQIKFKVEKHLLKIPNQAEVTIFNLAFPSRELFVDGPVRVRLEAGYDNDPRLLFIGDLRFASSTHTKTEWQTKLQLADGGRAYAVARHNKSYAKGTPVSRIIGDLAQSFGVSVPPEVNELPELRARIPTGEVVTGYTADELERLLDPYGMEFSFQNGKLQIMRSDDIIPGTVRVISQDDGMIEAPVIDPPKLRAPHKKVHHRRGTAAEPKVPKLKVKHLLYPEITPGERIEVRSKSINGIFRVDAVTHEGDFRGSEWTTHIEGRSV